MNSPATTPAHTAPPPRLLKAIALLLLIPLSAPAVRALAPVSNPNALQAKAAAATPSGFGPLDPSPLPAGLTPEQLIAKFGERELAFAKARDQYTFRQSVKVETFDDTTNKPNGAYQQVTDIVFSDSGGRSEHVVFAPANTMVDIMMSQADFDDIAHRLPFVLTTPDLPQYNLTYLGRQKVDDIDTYVLDCKPKVLVKGKRYFQGKVWVDQQEFQIVLINGKSVPDDLRRGHEDLSPPYTTYYSEVDGGFWFPVYTKADGVLHFPAQEGATAQNARLRYVVKYEDYKRFHAKSRIIYNGSDLPADAPPPSATPTPPTATPNGLPPPTDPNALPPADPSAPTLKRPKS